jgi:hypothetical protein
MEVEDVYQVSGTRSATFGHSGRERQLEEAGPLATRGVGRKEGAAGPLGESVGKTAGRWSLAELPLDLVNPRSQRQPDQSFG